MSDRRPRVTVDDIRARKARGGGREPLVMLTAYELVSATAAEAAGVDAVLVGDSAAMTVLGYASTRDVSLDEMLMLCAAVRRALKTTLLVGDFPYGTYERDAAQALATARRFVAAGCDAVKLEGALVEQVRAIVDAGIPVMGHVGLTPQRTGGPEGFRVQGKTADAALQLLREAEALERAGCFAVVFEAVPAAVAALISPRLTIPTIGIGAGEGTDGQVLVFHDLVGLYAGRAPKFVRKYADLQPVIVDALTRWAADVRARKYPDGDTSYSIAADELSRLRERLDR